MKLPHAQLHSLHGPESVSVSPMLRACRVSVNFSMQLIKLIRETRYLDRMGFNIPEIALNVTLQEEKYYSCTDGLANMLDQYYQVTAAPIAASAGASSACAVVGGQHYCPAVRWSGHLLSCCTHLPQSCAIVQVTEQLKGVEQHLLSHRLAQLRTALNPGFSPLNWNSLGIPDFVASCNKVNMLKLTSLLFSSMVTKQQAHCRQSCSLRRR